MKTPGPKHSRSTLARRLRVQQLVVFEQVVQSGSILAASRELLMTQPAVSKSVRELEQQLDGVLFVRSKRGVALTEFGTLFRRHTQTLLGELRHLADDLNAWQTGASGHVTVGTLITASATLLPEAIAQLRKRVPDVVVTVRVGANSVLFPALARGDLDVVVGFVPDAATPAIGDIDHGQLTHVTLYREALCVVVGSQDALARRRKIGLGELRDREWIVPTPDSVAYPSVRPFFERAGLAMPQRVVESVSILTNLGLLAGGSMVALMPQSAAERFARAGLLALLPLEGLSPFGNVGYTVRSDRSPSAAVQRLLEALRNASRALQRRR